GGYACISIGKGELLGGTIPEALRWNVAFGLAAVVMTISLLTFVFTKRTLGPIGLSPMQGGKSWMTFGTYLLSLALVPVIMTMVAKTEYTDWFMYIIGPATLVYLIYEMTRYSKV